MLFNETRCQEFFDIAFNSFNNVSSLTKKLTLLEKCTFCRFGELKKGSNLNGTLKSMASSTKETVTSSYTHSVIKMAIEGTLYTAGRQDV